MLFRKNIEPRCAYCELSTKLSTGLGCPKVGIVKPEHHCHSFKYDPFKRVPPKPASINADKFKDEDFSLD